MLTGLYEGVRQYLAEIWECRYFWFHLVKCDLQKRYRRSVLGIGWSMLQPLSMALILSFVYSKALGVDFWQFGPALLIGLAFWTVVQQSSIQGCLCFINAEPYLRQQPLPSAIFPLRVVLICGFHFMISLVLAAGFSWFGSGTIHPLGLLAAVPCVALVLLFCWGLATIAAFAHVYLADTQHLMEVGLQMVFYLTPIIYPPSLLQNNGLGWVIEINPLAQLLELLRVPLLTGELPSLLAVVKGLAVVLPPVGLAVYLVSRLESDLVFAL